LKADGEEQADRLKLTVPAYIRGLHPEVEQLMFKFGNCRRRAYSMKGKGMDRPSIIRQQMKTMEASACG
jgi:hypothetical protein